MPVVLTYAPVAAVVVGLVILGRFGYRALARH